MSAAAVTALLNRAGMGMWGGDGEGEVAASENSLHQIHLGLCCVFIMFACVCVCVLVMCRCACFCLRFVFFYAHAHFMRFSIDPPLAHFPLGALPEPLVFHQRGWDKQK